MMQQANGLLDKAAAEKTLYPIEVRLNLLARLEKVLRAHQEAILHALQEDLGKPMFEGYGAELGLIYEELAYVRKNLKSWAKPKRIWPSLVQFPARTYITYEPRGKVLILSPWNYPIQLSLMPLIGAWAAGNVVALKPSELAPASAQILHKILSEHFAPTEVQVFLGDATVAQQLLQENWDYIFFTGSTRVGKIIAQATAQRLIPYTLELGGKSPVIVEKDAKIPMAAKRIAWGKWINAGQTCIAPDYVLVHQTQTQNLLYHLKRVLTQFYGDISQPPKDYARIINTAHYHRLVGYLQEGEIYYGGHTDEKALYISPTILVNPTGKVLEEEIFGPILPVIPFKEPQEVYGFIQARAYPLALYIFTEDSKKETSYLKNILSGTCSLNDTVLQVGSSRLPFGGIRQSGIGAYHGKYSFETFSHRRTVLKQPTWIDLPLRYPPYKNKISLLKWIVR
ncbi:MAG: aldehyde dehydrogenase family protein [Bacteroidia bacterium]